jgi:hypothetical protein
VIRTLRKCDPRGEVEAPQGRDASLLVETVAEQTDVDRSSREEDET